MVTRLDILDVSYDAHEAWRGYHIIYMCRKLTMDVLSSVYRPRLNCGTSHEDRGVKAEAMGFCVWIERTRCIDLQRIGAGLFPSHR